MTKKTNEPCKQAIIFTKTLSRRRDSIVDQFDVLGAYCIKNGLSIIKEYAFVGENSRDSHKKLFEMLDFVKSRNEKIAIVVYSVDKLQRGLGDCTELNELCQKDKIELHFYREGLIIDKDSSATDIARWNMHVLSAKMYLEALNANIKRKQLYNWAQGKWQGPAPIGYLNKRIHGYRSTIEIDPVRAPLVKRLFEEYSTGNHSMKSLAKLANGLDLCSTYSNGKPISQTCINNLLKNPFYIGKMCVKGILMPHIYPPIIDKSLFDKVQNRLSESRC